MNTDNDRIQRFLQMALQSIGAPPPRETGPYYNQGYPRRIRPQMAQAGGGGELMRPPTPQRIITTGQAAKRTIRPADSPWSAKRGVGATPSMPKGPIGQTYPVGGGSAGGLQTNPYPWGETKERTEEDRVPTVSASQWSTMSEAGKAKALREQATREAAAEQMKREHELALEQLKSGGAVEAAKIRGSSGIEAEKIRSEALAGREASKAERLLDEKIVSALTREGGAEAATPENIAKVREALERSKKKKKKESGGEGSE